MKLTAFSSSPELLDGENRTQEHRVHLALVALMLNGVPNYEHGKIILNGANVNGEIQIRQVNYARQFVCAAGGNDWTLNEATISETARVLAGILAIDATKESFGRLRRALSAWMTAAREVPASERIHNFVRVLDGLTRSGGAGAFSVRTRGLLGIPGAEDSRLQAMYRLRNATCHLDEWKHAVAGLAGTSDAAIFATELSRDVEIYATRALRHVLCDEAVRLAFASESGVRRLHRDLETRARDSETTG